MEEKKIELADISAEIMSIAEVCSMYSWIAGTDGIPERMNMKQIEQAFFSIARHLERICSELDN